MEKNRPYKTETKISELTKKIKILAITKKIHKIVNQGFNKKKKTVDNKVDKTQQGKQQGKL